MQRIQLSTLVQTLVTESIHFMVISRTSTSADACHMTVRHSHMVLIIGLNQLNLKKGIHASSTFIAVCYVGWQKSGVLCVECASIR